MEMILAGAFLWWLTGFISVLAVQYVLGLIYNRGPDNKVEPITKASLPKIALFGIFGPLTIPMAILAYFVFSWFIDDHVKPYRKKRKQRRDSLVR